MKMDAKSSRLWSVMLHGYWIHPARRDAVLCRAERYSAECGSEQIITGPLVEAINADSQIHARRPQDDLGLAHKQQMPAM